MTTAAQHIRGQCDLRHGQDVGNKGKDEVYLRSAMQQDIALAAEIQEWPGRCVVFCYRHASTGA